ncbi:MAG: hypothetical protein Q7K03_04995 [Dehalococcoidia bacterium]|nr:hypothetical protein [Dehalococcoidia bacterium]
MPWIITALVIGSAIGIWVGFWEHKRMVNFQNRAVMRDIRGNVLFGAARVAIGVGILWGVISTGLLLFVFWVVSLF